MYALKSIFKTIIRWKKCLPKALVTLVLLIGSVLFGRRLRFL